MKKGEQFKIESVEELKEAYEMFKDEWFKRFGLKKEIDFFEKHKMNYLQYRSYGITLYRENSILKTIPSPLKKESKAEKIKHLEKELAELKALPKIKLQVHESFKFLAVDEDGNVFAYSEKPLKNTLVWALNQGSLKELFLSEKKQYYLNSLDWEDSLHEIEHIE